MISWEGIQTEVTSCVACRSAITAVSVDCPPGLLYPSDVVPPDPIRILFIGVAPPQRGRHFYTEARDKLRLGLFRVLDALDIRLTSIPDFLGRGFFLVHTAKCGIAATHKPNLDVSTACSRRFLTREIALLHPLAICGLSANVVHPVLRELSTDWTLDAPLTLGRLTRAVVGGQTCSIMTTKYPTMQWEEETRTHIGELLRVLATA